MKKTLFLLALGLPAAGLFPSPAAARDRFTVKDFVTLPMVGGEALSPGGKRLAFHRTVRDLKKDTYLRQVYLADLETGKVLQLTREPGNSWSPMWAPGGKGLAFYSTRSGKPALWLTRLDGADPKKICDAPVSGAKFSPDGRKIAFLAPPRKTRKNPGFGKDPEVWTWVEDRTKWPQLWVLDLATGKRTQLTGGKSYIYQFAWRPDGKALAYTFDPRGSEGVSEDHHLGLVDLEGKTRLLEAGPVKHSWPAWSPDGRRLACFRDRTDDFDVYLTIKDIWIYDPASGKRIRNLTRDWKGNPTGMLSSPIEPMHWSPDGKWIWFSGAEGANLNIYRVPADGSGPVEAVTSVEGEIRGLTFDQAFHRVAFLWSDFAHPADIFFAAARPSGPGPLKASRVTSIRKLVEKYGFQQAKTLHWKSFDGTVIEGFLFLPRGYKKGRPVPVIFHAHGGPAFRWGRSYSYRYMYHVWADHGYGMLLVNPRGSTGYGLKFQRGNYRSFGHGDFKDLMAGVDYLVARGIADPEKLGMTGYSYGGYMTNMAVSRTTRFKAAVSIAGGFNFPSAMGQSNSILPRAYYHPLESPEAMLRMFRDSPVARVMQVKTPILLIHGKKDEAVHHMQGVEFFTFLQLCHVPSKLILYPGEGHGINRPTHMLNYLTESLKWFRKYMPPR